MDQGLIDLISSHLPSSVGFSASGDECISSSTEELLSKISEGEKQLLGERASDKRMREFCLGRLAAKAALAQLFENREASEFEILRKNFRAPLWPTNSVGSISHCSNSAVAVAGLSQQYQSLGLDLITRSRIVNPKVLSVLCSPNEQETLIKSWDGDLNVLRLIVFSAKESLYKIFSNLNVTRMEWADFGLELPTVSFDQSNFIFQAKFSIGLRAKMQSLGLLDTHVDRIPVMVITSNKFIFSFGCLATC